jgi:AmpE protein
MTFLTVLLALFIERVLQQHRPRRQHRWFDRYCASLSRASFAKWLMASPWGAIIALLPPLLLIAWLQIFLAELGGLFALVFGVAVLLYSLGPRELGEEAEDFIAARDAGDHQRANTVAQAFCLSEVPETEPGRSFTVARAVVVLAAPRLIAPIFWFVAFGAVGAAAYRAIQLLAGRLQREECPQVMKRHSDEMRHIADWAPARITAAGYAIAGNFDAVAHAWRTFDHTPSGAPLNEAEHLLANTGLAALDSFPDEAGELGGDTGEIFDTTLVPPVVEDALALVWRSLAMWLTVIAGGSLVAALT